MSDPLAPSEAARDVLIEQVDGQQSAPGLIFVTLTYLLRP